LIRNYITFSLFFFVGVLNASLSSMSGFSPNEGYTSNHNINTYIHFNSNIHKEMTIVTFLDDVSLANRYMAHHLSSLKNNFENYRKIYFCKLVLQL
jgi:hypothetical protein